MLAERCSAGNNNSQSIHTLNEPLQQSTFSDLSLLHIRCTISLCPEISSIITQTHGFSQDVSPL